MKTIKIMGYDVIINQTSCGLHIDLSKIPPELARWKWKIIQYLEQEGFLL